MITSYLANVSSLLSALSSLRGISSLHLFIEIEVEVQWSISGIPLGEEFYKQSTSK